MNVPRGNPDWQVEHITIRVSLDAEEQATPEQWAAIGRLARRADLRVMAGVVEALPAGWLAFDRHDGINGGIAPDGSVST